MIAYSLFVHKNPDQVSRLINRIYASEDKYYINVFNAKSDIDRDRWREAFREFPEENVFITFKYGDSWGTFEQVEATLNAMKYFKQFDYQYFVNLSGQDYPLKSVDFIKRTLQDGNVSYMDYVKMPSYGNYCSHRSSKRPACYFMRYEYQYYRIPSTVLIKRIVRKLGGPIYRVDLPLIYKIPRINKKLLNKLNFYAGSSWFCLLKRHVNYILDFTENNPEFVKFFRHSLCPDEHFFQTIIMNSNFKDEIIRDNLRHIVWNEEPIIFSTNDAESLKTSPKLFARKFDVEIDSNILNIIDNYIDSP